MEGVDPVSDFLETRGTLQPNVTYRRYDVQRDQADSPTDPWADPIAIRGSHDVPLLSQLSGIRSIAGDIVSTLTTWTITSITSNVDLDLPRINSKIITDCETWLILDVRPNPRNKRLFECRAQLIPSDP